MSDLTAALAECGLSSLLIRSFIQESGLASVADLAFAEHEELCECLRAIGMRSLKAAVTARRLAALVDASVVPPSLRDGSTTALPQPMPPAPAPTSLSVDAGSSALRPVITPAPLLVGCEMDHPRVVAPSTARSVDGARRAAAPTPDSARSTTAQATSSDYLKEVAPSTAPSVDGVRRALAPALTALAPQLVTASLQPPSVVIADAEHLPSDIPGPSESVAPVPLSFRDIRRLSGIIARSILSRPTGKRGDRVRRPAGENGKLCRTTSLDPFRGRLATDGRVIPHR